MNTTVYGEEYERLVFKNLERMLKRDELPSASSKRSKLFHHKKYLDERNREYIFDCSIETYLSEEHEKRGEWSSLIVIECKRYKNKVDIGDLDEFEGKLSKISPFGIKGYFVTSSGFSETAINQARSLHYALVVCNGEDNWEWLTTRNTCCDKNEMFLPTLKGDSPIGLVPLAFSDGVYYDLSDLLIKDGVILPHKSKFKAPYLPKEKVKEIASALYSKFIGIDDDIAGHILAKLYPNFRITFGSLPNGILGTTSFSKHLITISDTLSSNSSRLHFTIAHELGHI